MHLQPDILIRLKATRKKLSWVSVKSSRSPPEQFILEARWQELGPKSQ